MKNKWMFKLMCVGWLCLAAAQVFAATRYVPVDGTAGHTEHATVAEAIVAATAGDEILVQSDYVEATAVTVDKNCTIRSIAADYIADAQGAKVTNLVTISAAGAVNLTGLVVDRGAQGNGIWVTSAASVSLTSCTVKNCWTTTDGGTGWVGPGPLYSKGVGLAIEGAATVSVDRCLFDYNQASSIIAGAGSTLSVQKSRFTGGQLGTTGMNGWMDQYLDPGAPNDERWFVGYITLYGAVQADIINNTFADGCGHTIGVNTGNPTITITHNTIARTGATNAANSNLWFMNFCTADSNATTLRNNIIESVVGAVNGAYAGFNFDYNTLSNISWVRFNPDAATVGTHNQFDAPCTFVDRPNGNFMLVSGSAGEDAGTNAGVAVDITGASRDMFPDMGAYEITEGKSFPVAGVKLISSGATYDFIQDAVTAAAATDTIELIKAGTYLNINPSSAYVDTAGKNLTIRKNATGETVVKAPFTVPSGTVDFDGITIAPNANANGIIAGGAANVTVQNCLVKACLGQDSAQLMGHGVLATGGVTLNVSRSVFEVPAGGQCGVYVGPGVNATIARSKISAPDYAWHGSDDAPHRYNGAVIVEDNGTTATIENCVFSTFEEIVRVRGNAKVAIRHSTVWNSKHTGGVAAIRTFNAPGETISLSVNNSILGGSWFAVANTGTGTVNYSGDYNILENVGGGSFLSVTGGGAHDQTSTLNTYPLFVVEGLPTPDYHLQNGSPAYDAAVSIGVAVDYDGNTRDMFPDMGAFEQPDTSQASVVISSTALNPTDLSPIPVTAVFSKTMLGKPLLAGAISVANGTAENVTTTDDKTYMFDVAWTVANITVTIQIPAGAAQDKSYNDNAVSNQLEIGTKPYSGPTVYLSSNHQMYDTLALALAAADTTSDTLVCMYEGRVYAEDADTLGKNVTIVNGTAGVVTIQGSVKATTNNVVVQGFKIAPNAEKPGAMLDGAGSLTVQNCTIQDCLGFSSQASLTGAGMAALAVNGGALTVQDSVIDLKGSFVTATGVDASQCGVYGGTGSQITLNRVHMKNVTRNWHNAGTDQHRYYAYLVFEGNTSANVTNCLLDNPDLLAGTAGNDYIRMYGNSNATFRHCTIWSEVPSTPATRLDAAAGETINLDMKYCVAGGWFWGIIWNYEAGGTLNYTDDYNLFNNARGSGYVNAATLGTHTVTNNSQGYVGFKKLAAANADFHLSIFSPAANFAVGSTEALTLDDVTRDATPDAGCYEAGVPAITTAAIRLVSSGMLYDSDELPAVVTAAQATDQVQLLKVADYLVSNGALNLGTKNLTISNTSTGKATVWGNILVGANTLTMNGITVSEDGSARNALTVSGAANVTLNDCGVENIGGESIDHLAGNGIAALSGATLTLNRCVIDTQNAQSGVYAGTGVNLTMKQTRITRTTYPWSNDEITPANQAKWYYGQVMLEDNASANLENCLLVNGEQQLRMRGAAKANVNFCTLWNTVHTGAVAAVKAYSDTSTATLSVTNSVCGGAWFVFAVSPDGTHGVNYTGDYNVLVKYADVSVPYFFNILDTEGANSLRSEDYGYPAFANAAALDLQCTQYSPMVNKASTASPVLQDIAGRVRDSKPDIGCYEFSSPASARYWELMD